jgi:mannose-1-phosphate guanylyltransferase/mannose-6-phosphate isomerase
VKIVPVIICGGSGTRLWPVSRVTHPKPFIPLPGGDNLIRKTFSRASALPGVDVVLTVTNRDIYFKTLDEYNQVNSSATKLGYVLEPFGRNTAAAIVAAACELVEVYGPETLMLVMPADHLIEKQSAFAEAVDSASRLAADGWLVTFGVTPEYPETGYGYIHQDTNRPVPGGVMVKRFVEKPDLKTAQNYVDMGEYLWNSGIFCFNASTLINEMETYAPDIVHAVKICIAESKLIEDAGQVRTLSLNPDFFSKVPDISIDNALMEHSEKVVTVPCDIGWSDIGSWSAMRDLVASDADGNRLEGEVLVQEAKNNFVLSNERLTALVGVKDLIIVDTPDAILVAHKDHAQDVKHIVAQLKLLNHEAHKLHQTVYRPWGTYTTLEEGARFKIKRIVVKPKGSLSLQMHHHRSEHWIVVSGMARIINDEQELMLNSNESTFIRAGHKHRLENPGVIDLVMIEVQSGDYLGEDDIVRFQDIYGRVNN